jgi:glycosyltransferase involved in cell wall biosynthesis
VFLNLSEFEAYGITVAEALAAGTPCVVREAGALGDWTAHRGCVGVSTVDPQSVRNAASVAVGTVPSVEPSTWSDTAASVVEVYTSEAGRPVTPNGCDRQD